MSPFKKAILFLHRWLGFISGLVVFVVSLSGCIYCFQDELQDALYSYRKVEVAHTPMLKPSEFEQRALAVYPKDKINSVLYFGDDRPVQVRIIHKKVLHSLFFNPYNGKLLADQDFKNTFFNRVKSIHLYCFMPPAVGKMVVGVSVILFVIIMISGIILWWPKRRSDRKRSFTIKWKGKWRRVNYDLHNVLGFYACAFALVTALSGLSMSFDWFGDSIAKVANLGKTYPLEAKKFKSDTLHMDTAVKAIPVIDNAYQLVRQRSPRAQMLILIPGAKKSSTLAITAYPKALNFRFNDGYTFDKYSGKLLRYLPNTQKSAGMKFSNMNYDIHVGQILGLFGKMITFLTGLICASLPITGLLVYLGKKKKPKSRKIKHAITFKQRLA
jgi:uncharacterized iron-regulated membrane protein